MSIEEQILLCAVRYALGRRSYIVGVVAEYVAVKRTALSEQCVNLIIRDIKEELERYHRAGQTLGDDCDERTWINLQRVLESMRERRNE